MRASLVVVLFVLTILASVVRAQSTDLLRWHWDASVQEADLPRGFSPSGGPSQQGWSISQAFSGQNGSIRVRMTYHPDDHPLANQNTAPGYMQSLRDAATAAGGGPEVWVGPCSVVAPGGVLTTAVNAKASSSDTSNDRPRTAHEALNNPPRRRVDGGAAEAVFILGRLEVLVTLQHRVGRSEALSSVRTYGEALARRTQDSLEAGSLTKMDTWVRDTMNAAGLETIMPDGFTPKGPASATFDGHTAYIEYLSDTNRIRVHLSREPATDKARSAAERRQGWIDNGRVIRDNGRVILTPMGIGQSHAAQIFEGRWTLRVSFSGVHRNEFFDKNAPYSREEALDLIESLAPASWGLIFGAEVEVEEVPEAETTSGPSERDLMLLARLEEMDGILGALEQPLQEALVELQILSRAQEKLRTEMRELSALARSVNDDKLKEKIRERISLNAETLRQQGRALAEAKGAAIRNASEAESKIRALFEGEDYGALEDAARTRFELMVARAHLFRAQVALVTGDTRGAIRISEEMRANFRLKSHARSIEGMALLHEGKTLDALAVFRNARLTGVSGAGAPFEALERETEIRVLRSLQRLSGETSRAFQGDFEQWVSGRAESNRPSDQTTFEWLFERFLKRPWYDTISGVTGVGVAEADARGEEAGIIADDMAVTHVGLNFIIALRRDHDLGDIRTFTTEDLRAAARARWGRDLREDEIERMRTAIRYAFELPDLRKLADREAHLERSSFSGPLVDQVVLEDRWTQGAELLAMGGSVVNGWSMLTQFAPAAKLSMAGTAATGTRAAEALKDTVTLGEYFAASRPVSAALQRMHATDVGRAAMRMANGIDEFAQSGVLEGVTVMGAQMAVEGGAAYVAQSYGGEAGAMLVDVISASGATGPEFYARAFRDMTKEQVSEVAGKLASRAAAQRAQTETMQALASEVGEEGVENLASFERRVRGAEVEPELAARLVGYAEVIGGEDAALAMQARRDLDRMIARQTRLAEQASEGATAVERAATALADDGRTVPADGRRTAPAEPTTVEARERPIGDPLEPTAPDRRTVRAETERAPVGDPLATSEPGSARSAVGDPLATNADGGGSSGTREPDGTVRGDRADEPVTRRREDPNAPRGQVDLRNVNAPEHGADVMLSRGDFDEAIATYQQVLTELPESSPRRQAIRDKLELAREARRHRIELDASVGTRAEPPIRIDEPSGASAVREVVEGEDATRWVSVLSETGERTASAPKFVKDGAGRNIAVTKSGTGMAGHPEGRAEHLASLLSEAMDRSTPRTRPLDASASDGIVMTELMPQGVALADAHPTAGKLLAQKDDLAEDLVFSMLIGDGDRHFGNYRVTTDNRLVPFDYGLADIVRAHPYRQARFVDEIRPAYEAARRELDDLLDLASPTSTEQIRIRKLRNDLEVYQRRALYQDIMDPVSPPAPGEGGIDAFVEATSDRQLEWATRAWRDEPGFLATVSYEDFEPHIERLRAALDRPGVLDGIVDQAMQGHPDIEYTRSLLRTRLEKMDAIFSRRFPRRSPRRRSRKESTRVPTRAFARTPRRTRGRHRIGLRPRRVMRIPSRA